MRNVTVERTVAASRSSVWAVLADYPNIADWSDGVHGALMSHDHTWFGATARSSGFV